ncbi:hypothetical protein QAD02_021344 [Eretmocerus hayati]|uniref:Uncharacterized protein n=1 Tax=Eretmocerus hayati TaxID=131215 RepID=A0ACC2PPX0_9HYME|nr:hypothetical protein QAD02_021344 [Eretmocerus hayati]
MKGLAENNQAYARGNEIRVAEGQVMKGLAEHDGQAKESLTESNQTKDSLSATKEKDNDMNRTEDSQSATKGRDYDINRTKESPSATRSRDNDTDRTKESPSAIESTGNDTMLISMAATGTESAPKQLMFRCRFLWRSCHGDRESLDYKSISFKFLRQTGGNFDLNRVKL